MTDTKAKRAEQRQAEIHEALNDMVEDTIRQSGPLNALAWTAVVLGAFLLNLGLLVVVSGG